MRGIKKFVTSLLVIGIIQILLLLFFPAAQSYLIGSVFEEVSAEETNNQSYYESESSMQTTGNSFSGETVCCPETNEGAVCQNLAKGEEEQCAEEVLPTDCSNVQGCELGCCVDEEEGLCSTKSTEAECNSLGGLWKDEPNCLVQECQKSCCVLGDEAKFTTEKRCEKLSANYGFEKDFRQVGGELECLALAANRKEGACLFSTGACQRLTEKSCLEKEGEFAEGYLCTSEELNTSCQPTNQTTCSEGKDGVYFLDSCGNLGNIYDSSKVNNEEYWEEIISIENSCNYGSGNINSGSCGNCDRYFGSTCTNVNGTNSQINIDYGNSYCKDLSCSNAPDVVDAQGNVLETKDRMNGESWCVYDSKIGKGLDTVGSRHWKYYCQEGEVVVEGCGDYRQGICIESEIKEESESFSQANCKMNTWSQCAKYNGEIETSGDSRDYSKMQEKCEKNQDCYIKEMDFGEGYHTYTCLPKYPPGFQLSNTEQKMAQNTCDMADFECTKVEVKKIDGWACVAGCDCDSQQYSQDMNDWCKSLGDCGGYVNIVGETDKAYNSNSGNINLDQYQENVKPKDQMINAEDYSFGELIGQIAGTNPEMAAQKDLMESQKTVGLMNTVSGATSGIAMAAGWLGTNVLTTTFDTGLSLGSGVLSNVGLTAQVAPTWAGAASSAAIAGGVMTAVSYLAIEMFGLQGQAAMIVSVATAALVIANAGAAMLGAEVLGAAGFCGPFAWICAVAIIIIAALLKVFGIGETREETYVFNCMQWQPPVKNQDCDSCNDNPLKPCTQYRCSSLGSACQLINENTENPVCERIADDGTSPVISPGKVPEGYEFKEISSNNNSSSRKGIKIRQENGECIPEFTPVNFTLETDEYAQCKMAGIRTSNYEEMPNYLAGNNQFLKKHEAGIFMPSIGSLEVYNVTGNVKEAYGNMRLFVRCQDVNGNENIDEYGVDFCIKTGEDLTAARPVKFEPESESFLSYEENKTDFTMYINEPAECRYDLRDKKYEKMNYNLTCDTSLQRQTVYGWRCETELEALDSSIYQDKNEYFIRCKDQPWLKNTENASKRNANEESFIYTLKKSESELKIPSIFPEQGTEMDIGYTPYPINLEVTTSGGALQGKGTCYYKFSENASYSLFKNTGSNKHEQNFDKIMAENYEIFIKCEDVAGNVAEDKTSFKLNIDQQAPRVVRVFNEDNKLKILTDEEAKCYYNNEGCNFDIESNKTRSMTTAFSKEHSTELEDETYYIKCEDKWDWVNPGCAIIIKPELI